ncbi:MAG: pantetheine-phosphate adenylyltransferase [Promethearchaeota archaeon]
MKSHDGFIVGLGGTFDHLHAGHERLLDVAFRMGAKVIIGLSTDNLLGGKENVDLIQPFSVRKAGLLAFASSLGRARDVEVIPLDDQFGPAITSEELEVHVSSEETMDVALKMNQIRLRNGLEPLILVVIPLVIDKDGTRFSSTKIRKKIHDNNGEEGRLKKNKME